MGVAEIKDLFLAVPAPVSIGIREMAPAGAVPCSFLPTIADFMPVRGGMGMDAGAITGKGNAVRGEKPVP